MSTGQHTHAERLAKLGTLEGESARLGLTLDISARRRFARYLELLEEWRDRAGLTSLIDLPLAIAGGLDVPLRTAGDPSTWRAFLSANLPLRLYTLLLAD